MLFGEHYGLSHNLLCRGLDFRLESGPSRFFSVPDSVVTLCDDYLLSTLDVSRCSGKRLHGHLALNSTGTKEVHDDIWRLACKRHAISNPWKYI